MTDRSPGELDESTLGLLSEYLDGSLSAADRTALEARLANEPALQTALAELRETSTALKALHRTTAPASLGKAVEETIHRRSAGRFFGPRTVGDRVPFGALLVITLVALAAVGALLWASSTGSLRVERTDRPPPPPASRQALPAPPIGNAPP